MVLNIALVSTPSYREHAASPLPEPVRVQDTRTRLETCKNVLLSLVAMTSARCYANEAEPQNVYDGIKRHRSWRKIGLETVSFWSSHEADLPRLATIAERIMGIITSSASSELMFSASKRIPLGTNNSRNPYVKRPFSRCINLSASLSPE